MLRIPGPAVKDLRLRSPESVKKLHYPPARPGQAGNLRWFEQAARMVSPTPSAPAGSAWAMPRWSPSRWPLGRGQESAGGRPRSRRGRTQEGLRQAGRPARRLVGALLGALQPRGSRSGHPPAILPGALLLRRRLAPRRAADAVAGRLVRGRRFAPAVERRLPQRPQHPDDLHRLPDVRRLRRRRVLPRLPLGPAARLSPVRPGLLRRARRRRAGRDEPGRPTARRLGPIQPLAHDGRLERAPLLPALAPHRRRHLPARPRLSVLPRDRRLPARAAQARRRRPAAAAALQLAGDLRQHAPRVPQAQQQLRPRQPEDALPRAGGNGRRPRRRHCCGRLGGDREAARRRSTPNPTARCCSTQTRRCPAATGTSRTSSPSTRST